MNPRDALPIIPKPPPVPLITERPVASDVETIPSPPRTEFYAQVKSRARWVMTLSLLFALVFLAVIWPVIRNDALVGLASLILVTLFVLKDMAMVSALQTLAIGRKGKK